MRTPQRSWLVRQPSLTRARPRPPASNERSAKDEQRALVDVHVEPPLLSRRAGAHIRRHLDRQMCNPKGPANELGGDTPRAPTLYRKLIPASCSVDLRFGDPLPAAARKPIRDRAPVDRRPRPPALGPTSRRRPSLRSSATRRGRRDGVAHPARLRRRALSKRAGGGTFATTADATPALELDRG